MRNDMFYILILFVISIFVVLYNAVKLQIEINKSRELNALLLEFTQFKIKCFEEIASELAKQAINELNECYKKKYTSSAKAELSACDDTIVVRIAYNLKEK